MISSLITNKILLLILAAILAVLGVAAYNVHRANEYQRHLQKGLADMNKQKPPTQYTLP